MEGGGVWAPFKELMSVVNAAILRRDPEVYHNLDTQLKKHKPDFINLLKNPSQSSIWRARLQRSHEGGLEYPTLPTSLPQDLIAEAMELSDLLNLHEVSAVELLIAGEQQLPRFPTYSRKLLAFLLYHDGRRSIVAALRQLIQARKGVSWAVDLPPATANLVNSFTDQLLKEGLVEKILHLLDTISVDEELARHRLLDRNSGGGDMGGVLRTDVVASRHQQAISEFVNEQRSTLAECLLYWTSQSPFGKEDTVKILKYLQKVSVVTPRNCVHASGSGRVTVRVEGRDGFTASEEEGEYGVMDPVSLCLFHTLLACFNIGDNTAENAVDDSLMDDDHRIVSDMHYLHMVHAFITSEDVQWTTPELRDAVFFAWGVLLRECGSRAVFENREELEQDEKLITLGIKGRAFLFLRRSVMAAPKFHSEEWYVKRMHWLLTSFIINNHLKIKELRNYGDEVAKGAGRRVRDVELGLGFGDLMMLVGDLYLSDPCDLRLVTEFWPLTGSPQQRGSTGLYSRALHSQISLCKFISTCSDFLPAGLFCSFMHMLNGLSSSPHTARHAFNLLEANSPALGGGGASAAISLEHFFNSLRQYYHGLRGGGVSSSSPANGCGISPQEVQGLMAVLTIIGTVAKHDASARVMMYENQAWLPVATLFGLIGCPVPQELKAKIFQTLATFALSPDIASSMWHTLEVTQVLNTQHRPTVGSGGMGVAGGGASYRQHMIKEGSIEVELRELECRNEAYPLTRAFLELLLVLVKVPIPPTLGVGYRVPGFSPYLQFVRDTIFLEFDTRAYRDQDEKWKVGRLALDIMHTLLISHELTAEDFTMEQKVKLPHGDSVDVPRPPGFTILEHMLSDSQLLKKVLSVLHKALQVLLVQDHTPPSGALVSTALLCLKMLGAALERETDFHDHLRKSTVMKRDVTPLYRLLAEVNPCSNKPDHMINIAQYVCQTRCPAELALDAVLVLCGLCQTPKAGLDLAASLAGNKGACEAVMHGFVEHLEWEEELEGPDEQQDKDSLETVVGVRRAIQLQILKLLSSSIDRPAPNVAHLLLGFGSGSNSASDITLQDPGVHGSPRTCLHSILMLVEHPQNLATPIPTVHHTHPQLAELCYKLLYQLCAHSTLCVPTLRYLRNNHDFIHKQISHLPLNPLPHSQKSDDGEDRPLPTISDLSVLHQQAWLLRLAAIELRLTLLGQQRSHTQRLLNLLLSESNGNGGQVPSTFGLLQGGTLTGVESRGSHATDGRRKLLILLDLVDLDDYKVPPMDLEYFDSGAVEAVLKQCDAKDEVTGATYCEVKLLHRMLMSELYTAQGAPQASHQHDILKEIHTILSIVVERNVVQATSHMASEMCEAWRQLMEVTLHAMLQDGVKGEMKLAVIFEVIQDLLLKVSGCESTSLTTAVQGVVLILLSHLRLAVLSHTGSAEQEDMLLPSLYSGPLLVIMRGLLESMLRAPASLQQLRAYLLGSLLYYLTLTQQPDTTVDAGPQGLWDVEKKGEGIAEANMSTLNSFGEPFMDAVCKNACSGHDVTKMLSLSLLDAVVRNDWKYVWLKFLSQHGYLHNLCASLQWEDEGLKKMLDPVPEALRALYIYESKMAFLTRVADRVVGANELASIGAVNYLSQCRFIDLRPSHQSNSFYGDSSYYSQSSRGFIPTILERYRQLLFPLLKFLLALLTCPGPHHKKVVSQVTALIEAHSDVFAAVLKEEVTGLTISSLQELALVTALIAQSGVALSVPDWPMDSSEGAASSGRLGLLQGLMLKLLPRFWSAQCCRKIVKLVVEGEESEGDVTVLEDEASLLVHRISSNVVTYCRVAMTMKGMEFSVMYSRILLAADLSEALSTPSSQDPFSTLASSSVSSQRPSLGLLVLHLRECADGFMVAHDNYQQLLKKKDQPGPLSSDDVRQFLLPSLSADKLPVTQQQVMARRRLTTLVGHKNKELHHFAYVVENLLFLLWQHLRFYLVHSKPSPPQLQFGNLVSNFSPMRRLNDASSGKASLDQGVSGSDIEHLKVNLHRCLTDNLFKKLLELEEIQLKGKSDSRIGFVQALVRRIKKLLKLKTY